MELWAENAQGSLAMEAVATLNEDVRFAPPEAVERRPPQSPARLAAHGGPANAI